MPSRNATSAAANATGHELTLNGFGVMMGDQAHDPFVTKWISAAARMGTGTGRGDECALELGAAFGAASLLALRAGAACVVANDLHEPHLAALRDRWAREDVAGSHAHASRPGDEARRLHTLVGAVPEALRGGVR